jgi:hypothetical protein
LGNERTNRAAEIKAKRKSFGSAFNWAINRASSGIRFAVCESSQIPRLKYRAKRKTHVLGFQHVVGAVESVPVG